MAYVEPKAALSDVTKVTHPASMLWVGNYNLVRGYVVIDAMVASVFFFFFLCIFTISVSLVDGGFSLIISLTI